MWVELDTNVCTSLEPGSDGRMGSCQLCPCWRFFKEIVYYKIYILNNTLYKYLKALHISL